MGTVERDRIEYVGAEGARAMFDFTVSDLYRRTRGTAPATRAVRTNRRGDRAQKPAKRQKPAAGTSGRGTPGHPAPARVSCVWRQCPVCGISSTDEAPDRIVGDRRIALRARREPLDSTPLDRNPADRGPEGAQMLLVGVSTARTVVSLYDPISRVTYDHGARGTAHTPTHITHNVGPRNE